MNQIDTKSLLQSRTTVWALTALLAYALRKFGIAALPSDVNAEIVTALQMGLDALIPVAIIAAIWFRKKATAIVDRWF